MIRPSTAQAKGNPDGSNPIGSLIDVNGVLYGTTYGGGANGLGAVFEVTTSGTERILYSFKGFLTGDGADPNASLIDVNGVLYGTTYGGGANGLGTVFEVTTSGTESVLHSFKGASGDGAYPSAGLIDVNGALYGTTQWGGPGNWGTVFKVSL